MQTVTLNSEWQTGLPWMRLDTESLPLLAYNQLRVEKLVDDEVKAECYDEAMTGEFSWFEENSVLLVHDQLMVEKPYEGQVRTIYSDFHGKEHSVDQIAISAFSVDAGLTRVQVNLLVDHVSHEWIKTLRIVNYLLALPRRLRHRLHLIRRRTVVYVRPEIIHGTLQRMRKKWRHVYLGTKPG